MSAARPADTIDTQAAGVRPASTAGGRLRAAREAAGLSVDAVAQQLKLAPRQVKALEDDDWQRLPGRTFVRGFARNYARFLQLDPDAVLALLPASDVAPALERPTLTASRRPMGEIPVERVARPSVGRWLIPLLLLAVAGAIAYVQLSRSPIHLPALLSPTTLDANDAAAPSPAATPAEPVATPGTGTSTLPNPVVSPVAPDAATPAAASAAPTPPTAGRADATVPAPDVAAAPAPAAAASAAAASAASPPAAAAEGGLVLTFKGTSWAEVKDAKGRVVLQMTGGAGMTQTVTATPPLELSLGNAPAVAVTFRGHALDLSPYTRGNVARVSLQ